MSGKAIDIHAHLVPASLMERAEKLQIPGVDVLDQGDHRFSFEIAGYRTRVLPDRLVDVDSRLAWMDTAGIDMQVVGTWADLFGYALPEESAVAWASTQNDALIEAVSGTERLEAFATLPMQAPSEAAALVPGLLEAGFSGVTFATRVGEMELDDPSLEVVWKALSEHMVTAFVHPGYGDSDPRTADYGMINAVGRPVDTTIATTRILGAAIPMRFPGVKIILAHGGGAVPFILGRLRRNHAIDPTVGDPAAGLSKLYFDSVVFDPDALCYLVSKATRGSVLLGSDYPFPIGDPLPQDVVARASCLGDEERSSILGGAAQALLSRGAVEG